MANKTKTIYYPYLLPHVLGGSAADLAGVLLLELRGTEGLTTQLFTINFLK